MPDYKKLYLELFNGVTDAIALLDQGEVAPARKRLVDAQREAEERYIAEDDRPERERAKVALARLCEDLTGCQDPVIMDTLTDMLWRVLVIGFTAIRPALEDFLHRVSPGDACADASPPSADT